MARNRLPFSLMRSGSIDSPRGAYDSITSGNPDTQNPQNVTEQPLLSSPNISGYGSLLQAAQQFDPDPVQAQIASAPQLTPPETSGTGNDFIPYAVANAFAAASGNPHTQQLVMNMFELRRKAQAGQQVAKYITAVDRLTSAGQFDKAQAVLNQGMQYSVLNSKENIQYLLPRLNMIQEKKQNYDRSMQTLDAYKDMFSQPGASPEGLAMVMKIGQRASTGNPLTSEQITTLMSKSFPEVQYIPPINAMAARNQVTGKNTGIENLPQLTTGVDDAVRDQLLASNIPPNQYAEDSRRRELGIYNAKKELSLLTGNPNASPSLIETLKDSIKAYDESFNNKYGNILSDAYKRQQAQRALPLSAGERKGLGETGVGPAIKGLMDGRGNQQTPTPITPQIEKPDTQSILKKTPSGGSQEFVINFTNPETQQTLTLSAKAKDLNTADSILRKKAGGLFGVDGSKLETGLVDTSKETAIERGVRVQKEYEVERAGEIAAIEAKKKQEVELAGLGNHARFNSEGERDVLPRGIGKADAVKQGFYPLNQEQEKVASEKIPTIQLYKATQNLVGKMSDDEVGGFFTRSVADWMNQGFNVGFARLATPQVSTENQKLLLAQIAQVIGKERDSVGREDSQEKRALRHLISGTLTNKESLNNTLEVLKIDHIRQMKAGVGNSGESMVIPPSPVNLPEALFNYKQKGLFSSPGTLKKVN